MLRLSLVLFIIVGLIVAPLPKKFPEIYHVPITLANAAEMHPLSTLTSGYIQYIVLSPDETVLAVALPLEIQFYDITTNNPFAQPINVLTSSHGTVYRVSFHPDNERAAVSYSDGTVEIWIWKTSTLELTLQGHLLPVKALAFSLDGRYLATGSGALEVDDVQSFLRTNTVRIWDIATGDVVTWWGEIEALDVDFTADSKSLYVLSTRDYIPGWGSGHYSYALRRLDVGTHTTEVLFPQDVDERLDKMVVHQLSLSADNHWLVVPQVSVPTPVWNIAADNEVQYLPPISHVKSTAFSGDSRFMAMGKLDDESHARTLSLWDTTTWSLKKNFPTTNNIHQVLVDDTATKIITLQSDPNYFIYKAYQQESLLSKYRTVHIWDVATQTELATLKPAQLDISALKFHPLFPNLLVSAEWNGNARGRIQLWDTEEQITLQSWQDKGIMDVAFHPELPFIATLQVDNSISIRNLANSKIKWQKNVSTPKFTGLVFHPSGDGLVAYGDKTVLWNLRTNETQEIIGWQVNSFRFDENGKNILFGNALSLFVPFDLDEDIKTHDVQDYFTDAGPHIWELANDGQLIIGADSNYGYGGILAMWDVGEPGRPTYSLGFDGEITAMALHPTLDMLVLTTTDGQLHFINTQTKHVIATQKIQTGQYTHLAFNSDGSRLASVDNNGIVQIWGIE